MRTKILFLLFFFHAHLTSAAELEKHVLAIKSKITVITPAGFSVIKKPYAAMSIYEKADCSELIQKKQNTPTARICTEVSEKFLELTGIYKSQIDKASDGYSASTPMAEYKMSSFQSNGFPAYDAIVDCDDSNSLTYRATRDCYVAILVINEKQFLYIDATIKNTSQNQKDKAIAKLRTIFDHIKITP